MLSNREARYMKMMLTIFAGYGAVWLVVLIVAGVAVARSSTRQAHHWHQETLGPIVKRMDTAKRMDKAA
jgi:hypothetical protein